MANLLTQLYIWTLTLDCGEQLQLSSHVEPHTWTWGPKQTSKIIIYGQASLCGLDTGPGWNFGTMMNLGLMGTDLGEPKALQLIWSACQWWDVEKGEDKTL